MYFKQHCRRFRDGRRCRTPARKLHVSVSVSYQPCCCTARVKKVRYMKASFEYRLFTTPACWYLSFARIFCDPATCGCTASLQHHIPTSTSTYCSQSGSRNGLSLYLPGGHHHVSYVSSPDTAGGHRGCLFCGCQRCASFSSFSALK